MLLNTNDKIIKEHFDLSDKTTCRILSQLNESQKEAAIEALSSALYDSIVSNVDKIDFGTIPKSRGDITKVDGFDGTEKCINIMRRLIIEYKQSPEIIDIVITAIQNVKDRKALFIKGFTLNNEYTMLMYNLIVLSIERSVSLLIATCIEYVKDNENGTTKMALDKVAYAKAEEDLMYKQLSNFNKICANGVFDNSVDKAIKGMRKGFKESDEMVSDFEPNDQDSEIDSDFDPFAKDDVADVEPSEEAPVPAEVPEEECDDEPCDGVCDDEIPAPVADPMDGARPEEEVPEEYPAFGEEIPDDQVASPDEEVPDVEPEVPEVVDPEESPEQDTVEPENIPNVVPGDQISANDAPVNEIGIGVIIGSIVAGVGAAKLAGAAVVEIIKALRWIVYKFMYTRMKFSDYLEVQADLIEANANQIEAADEETYQNKDKVVKKQRKIAEKFRKWANVFSIDNKKSDNYTNKAVEEDEKKKRRIEDDEDALF